MDSIKYTEDSDVVFTTYFTSKKNPQANTGESSLPAPKDNLSYIFPWYASINTLGINGVIIHDGLSESFIKKYEKNNIKFYYYDPIKYSLNDERYFALDEILSKYKFRKVLMTDGNDLLIKKNPFEFFTNEDMLYFGADEEMRPKIKDNPWCINKLKNIIQIKGNQLKLDNSILDFEYVNAGVFGGSYTLVKEFNSVLVDFFNQLDDEGNNNMMSINYLLWSGKINYFKGAPLTSPFKKYQLQSDYFIIHK
jgi:hypothetical protein